jgi:hypothetical protein
MGKTGFFEPARVCICFSHGNHDSIQVMPSHHHSHHQDEEKHWLNKILQPGLHKDWRTWVVIGLMMAAISIYVLTLDESVQPVPAPQQGAPAETGSR